MTDHIKRWSVLPTLLAGGGGAGRGGGGFAGVEVVPVQDSVEGQEVGALGLPAPEGPEREHHDVTGADRHIHDQGAVGDGFAAAQGAGEQDVVSVGGELQDDAGAAAGENSVGGCWRGGVCARLYSAMKVEVPPSVISAPPCWTNLASSCKPSRPMPPRISSVSSMPPRLGVCSVFLYGMGAVPVMAM